MDVIAVGELLIDFVQIDQTEHDAPLMAANPGGAPLNYLGALAKYGCACGMVGKVGTDVFGDVLIQTLRGHSIEWLGQKTDEAFTTLAFVSLDERGERSFSFSRKPGADTRLRSDEIPYGAIKQAKIFHFGTLSLTDEPARSATMDAVRFAKEKGVPVTFDPNYRAMLWKTEADARAAMLWGFAHADIVKAGADELEFAFQKPWRDALNGLLANGVMLAFATMGSEGCFFASGHAAGFVDAYRVAAVDTTGAGDSFFGGFLYRFLSSAKQLREVSIEDAADYARFGNATATLCVGRRGGIPAMPKLEEILALLR